jgi:hypothetical protein
MSISEARALFDAVTTLMSLELQELCLIHVLDVRGLRSRVSPEPFWVTGSGRPFSWEAG